MKRKDIETVRLHSFEVTSGKLVVSDPCYDLDTWCKGVLEDVRNGTWFPRVVRCNNQDGWGERVAELIVNHRDWMDVRPDRLCKFEVGVDSGQAGVYDYPVFAQKKLSSPHLMVGEMYYLKRQYQHMIEEERRLMSSSSDKCERIPELQEFVDSAKQRITELQQKLATVQPEATEDWYRLCCDKTLGELGCGSIDGGVVSSSGYGDGSYEAFMAIEGNQVVAVKVVFIPEYEDEESWDDEDF